MASYFKSNRFSLFVPVIVFVVIACNNKTDEKATEKKDTTTDTTISTAQTAQTKSGFTGVTLDEVYMDATSFKNLPPGRRIFFALTYINPDIVALTGWTTTPSGGGPFNDPPVVLKKWRSIIINADTIYVGNVKLDPDDVQKIKADIDATGATYVLFNPSLSPTPLYRNHIQYTIEYTKDEPAVKKTPSLLPTATAVVANPSPPKAL